MAALDVHSDVFTLDELARATHTSAELLQGLVGSGRLPVVPGTSFVRGSDAVAIGRWLATQEGCEGYKGAEEVPDGHARIARLSSAGVHAVAAGLLLWAGGPRVDATVEPPATRTRLVFLVDPGAGGRGGGGVPSRPRPQPRTRPAPVAEVAPTPPPLEATTFTAPVLATTPTPPSRVSTPDRLEPAPRDAAVADGIGPGRTGGIGDTRGTGIGEGAGPGEGGAGNGNGRGVSPPRLLREVKAVYSEDARRLGITGNVVLAIVIEADGRVGEARIVRGLGAGLDERAVAAVREWQFAPARRLGTPVAVTVEVVVSFNLR